MVRSARIAAIVSLLAAACFADLSGFTDGADAGGGGSDGGGADASAIPPGTPPPSGMDASPDACKPSVTIDAPFASDLGGFSPLSLRVQGYPRVESFGGDMSAVLFPVPDSGPILVDAGPDADASVVIGPLEIYSARSGLWWPTPVPTGAFDVDVEVKVQCTVSGSCADGFVIAWLDLTDLSRLSNGNDGHTAGIPDMVAGAFVDLDDFKNVDTDEPHDPQPPTVQINALDPTKPAGTYQWTKSYASLDFLGGWHALSVAMRGGLVTVRVDGAVVTSTNVPPLANGIVGFSAGTGGDTDSVAIRNVHGRFYACTP